MNNRMIYWGFLITVLFLAPGISHARWMNPDTGRFHTMDSYEGDQENPISLHKYLYCHDNPANGTDPSGLDDVEDFSPDSSIDSSSIGGIGSRIEMLAAAVTGHGRPSSKKFWAAYTKVNYVTISDTDHHKVWELVGGGIGKTYGPTDQNTCATRMSYGLNYGGAEIPAGSPGASINYDNYVYAGKKGDNKRYIVSAASMQDYMQKAWGNPDYPQVGAVPVLNTIVSGLQADQVAVFATKGERGRGHAGALKKGYQDPYVQGELPVDVWKLAVP